MDNYIAIRTLLPGFFEHFTPIRSPLARRIVWFIVVSLMNAILFYFHTIALENEDDRVGWACLIVFLQVLWTVWHCLVSFKDCDFTRITPVYVFGSVGVVFINAVALMTELTLKTVNGEGVVGDVRIFVFPSESLFSASVLILRLFDPWIKKDLQCCQNIAMCKQPGPTGSHNQCSQTADDYDETQATGSNQNAGESHKNEMTTENTRV